MSVSKHHLINQAKIGKKSCNVGFKIDKTCWTSADIFQSSFREHGFDKTISSDFFSLYIFSLQIPGAETATISAITGGVALATNSGRLCGRVLNSATSIPTTTGGTVCGKSKLYS